MTHSSETEWFEEMLVSRVLAEQHAYFRRFVRYTSARDDPDHGLRIIRNQESNGLSFNKTADLAWREENYGLMMCRGMVGVSACLLAIEALCDRAGLKRIALMNCVSIAHVGAMGFHVNEIANRGYIGIAFLSTHPVMSLPPYSSRLVGNNLISVGIPIKEGANMVLDMSAGTTSVRAWLADLVEASKDNSATSEYVDHELRKHALSPIGGHKGAALAMTIQTIVAATGGGERRATPARLSDHCENHVLFIAIKPFDDLLHKAKEELLDMKDRFPCIHIPGEDQWT